MLDLQLINEKRNLYEVKLTNGKIIRLLPPTQGQYQALLKLQNVNKSEVMEMLDDLYDLLDLMLNNNVERAKVNVRKEIPVDLVFIVINDYFSFWSKEAEKVVFRQAQQLKPKK